MHGWQANSSFFSNRAVSYGGGVAKRGGHFELTAVVFGSNVPDSFYCLGHATSPRVSALSRKC